MVRVIGLSLPEVSGREEEEEQGGAGEEGQYVHHHQAHQEWSQESVHLNQQVHNFSLHLVHTV
jgi:hypothetical protein